MMIRLSASSLAGTARTLVAVGISSEACMLLTTRAGAPRNTAALAPAPGATAGSVQDGAGRLAGVLSDWAGVASAADRPASPAAASTEACLPESSAGLACPLLAV